MLVDGDENLAMAGNGDPVENGGQRQHQDERNAEDRVERQQNGGASSVNRPPATHAMGRKNGEADLEEKFGRFEIKPPSSRRGTSSQAGDETVSLVSDTWSTDVLPSDTETLGDNDNRPAVLEDLLRNNLDELSNNRLLDELAVPPSTGTDQLSCPSRFLTPEILILCLQF